MDRKLGDHISSCFAQAAEAKRQADATDDADAKSNFLSLERTWMELAQQYHFLERLEHFLMNERSQIFADDLDWGAWAHRKRGNFRAKTVKFRGFPDNDSE